MALKPVNKEKHFQLAIENKVYQIQLKTSQRKSYSLKILTSSEIELRAPLGTTVEQGLRLLEKHQKWIIDKTQQMVHKDKLENLEEGLYQVYYKGVAFKLSIEQRNDIKKTTLTCHESEKRFVLISQKPSLPEAEWYLTQFYKASASQMIKLSLDTYLPLIEQQPSLIQIKDQKARWGSCNQKRQIRLNFRIAQCNQKLCDYLVLHELCHLKHMNHSDDYWAYVAQFMPDYKLRRQALKGFAADRLIMALEKDNEKGLQF